MEDSARGLPAVRAAGENNLLHKTRSP